MYSQCGSDYIGADTMGKMLFDSQCKHKEFWKWIYYDINMGMLSNIFQTDMYFVMTISY